MNVIDTNSWLYSYDSRDPPKQGVAQQLIAATRPLALPWQVGCEFVAASRKLAAVGFTESKAWAAPSAMQAMAAFSFPRPICGRKQRPCKDAMRCRFGMRSW